MIPNMSAPVNFFSQQIKAIKRIQTVTNGFPVHTNEETSINATVQPLGVAEKQELGFDMLIEAIMIHCFANLDINDVIIYKSRRYTIKAKGDYSDYGYYEYFAPADTEMLR
jgi:hypothetical protein